VSALNFGVHIVLGATATVFYQNYLTFLQKIANSISQNINTLTIQSISSGSTSVSFLVSTNAAYNSIQAQQQQTNIQNTVSYSIAGMSVNSWSVVVNYKSTPSSPTNPSSPTTTNNDSSPSIGLILAIAIPVGVGSILLYI